MRHPLALALLLISAAASFSRADPLNESAPDLACPDCNQINATAWVEDGIVAVGAYGLIVYKSSAGRWQQLPGPVRRMLTSVVATREGHLVATGHDALILSSPGTGENWAIVHADPAQDAPLLDLWIGSDGRGLAVGAYGLALLTQDHGLNWAPHEIDLRENHFYAIDEAPDGSLFVCGEFGTVLRSHNRGEDWTRLDTGWDGTFFGCRCGDKDRILLYGLEGTVLESRNEGSTWQRLETGTSASLYDAAFLPDGRAILAGADGTVLLETLPGTFERVAYTYRESILKILVISPDTVLLFGEGGVKPLQLPRTSAAVTSRPK